jgi:hypothetical protein
MTPWRSRRASRASTVVRARPSRRASCAVLSRALACSSVNRRRSTSSTAWFDISSIVDDPATTRHLSTKPCFLSSRPLPRVTPHRIRSLHAHHPARRRPHRPDHRPPARRPAATTGHRRRPRPRGAGAAGHRGRRLSAWPTRPTRGCCQVLRGQEAVLNALPYHLATLAPRRRARPAATTSTSPRTWRPRAPSSSWPTARPPPSCRSAGWRRVSSASSRTTWRRASRRCRRSRCASARLPAFPTNALKYNLTWSSTA